MLTDAGLNARSSERCRKAQRYGIPVLDMEFLYDCIKSGTLLAVEPYIVLEQRKGESFARDISG